MDFIAIISMLVLIGIQNCICIVIGLKVGMHVVKGEPVKLPNPIEEYAKRQTEKQAKKEAKAEQDKIETILRNIENYDGTGFGQIDVPRG